MIARVLACLAAVLAGGAAVAQVPPSASEIAGYEGLHAAAAAGDAAAIRQLVAEGAELEARDRRGRTAVHVAAFASEAEALRALAEAGADMNALEGQAYDAVTITAVADDPEIMSLAIALGNDPGLVTSPYDGTALIAAAHLGHAEVVRRLIAAGAPLDHVNNLGWTALIESVVLGDGGPDHQAVARALLAAGADPELGDRQGATPLALAEARGYAEMAAILRAAGAE
ncbi:ankyrin repeat domain-containing protein [Ovoidimarina sediminis]|uniref:ankyrin repeat domain-containing protein n=1 Tax=Ovoidimarina sediminis TaxID=3079856 RepID=UPI00290C9314|nr:ankyrin repeat domain-containing protein [Rhodophyticola sp. MJ-SS7]MDU8942346.1 ankyrin repeat domain-containing protein [Rhodophyticola sp. MJ-SS7]